MTSQCKLCLTRHFHTPTCNGKLPENLGMLRMDAITWYPFPRKETVSCQNYRTISLRKVMLKVIKNCLNITTEELPTKETGYRPARHTDEWIFDSCFLTSTSWSGLPNSSDNTPHKTILHMQRQRKKCQTNTMIRLYISQVQSVAAL